MLCKHFKQIYKIKNEDKSISPIKLLFIFFRDFILKAGKLYRIKEDLEFHFLERKWLSHYTFIIN